MAKLSEVEKTLSDLLEKRRNDPKKSREYLDPTPMAPPIGFTRPRHIVDDVREMVRMELSRQAAAAGYESFDEAEDFDIDDEYDPSSPWEQLFEPTPVAELRERHKIATATPVAPPPAPANPAPSAPPPNAHGGVITNPNAGPGGDNPV